MKKSNQHIADKKTKEYRYFIDEPVASAVIFTICIVVTIIVPCFIHII